jgi:hypothetical protein
MKTCTKCQTLKELTSFPPRGAACRSCIAAKTKLHVSQNRALYKHTRKEGQAAPQAIALWAHLLGTMVKVSFSYVSVVRQRLGIPPYTSYQTEAA